MLGTHDAACAAADAADPSADARATALALMYRALEHLDSDAKIPSIIGAQLQSAIDALWRSSAIDRSSIHLH